MAGGLQGLGMDTQATQGDPGVTVSASPEGMHIRIGVAGERHLGLLMKLEIRSEALDRQAILQAE